MDNVSDLSGRAIPPGKGATIRVELGRAKQAVWELRVTQEEADRLMARRTQHQVHRLVHRPLRQLRRA